MSVHVAESLDEVCGLLAADPSASLLAGGTDFMVEVNYSGRRPASVIAVDRVPELTGWRRRNGSVEMGAAMTYAEMEHPLFAAYVPALAQAARTVGSPQIRNAGTLGGNLATASPAGDTLPPLAALDARVTVCSVRGSRELGLDELIVGPKQNTLGADEVISSVSVPVVDGPQEFLKVGTPQRHGHLRGDRGAGSGPHAAARAGGARVGGAGAAAGHRGRGLDRRCRGLGLHRAAPRKPPGPVRRVGGSGGPPHRRSPQHRRLPAPRRGRYGPPGAGEGALVSEGTRSGEATLYYTLHVNGADREVADAWLGESLLYVLRERLGLPGTKNACDQGECGSCTVLADGAPVCSCLMLAAAAVGREIVTVEGLGTDGELTDIQQAFVDHGAVQCGFCTPGLIVTTDHLLARNPAPTELEIREAISGNLCRCTGYGRVIAAIAGVAQERAAAG